MKIFKSGEIIRADDINSNFSKCIKTDLSNCPIIPCNKGGTGRTDCTIAYADKAGIAELAEVATIAKGLQLEEGSESIGLIDLSNIVWVRTKSSLYSSDGKINGNRWLVRSYSPDYGNKWLCIWDMNITSSTTDGYGNGCGGVSVVLGYSHSQLKIRVVEPNTVLESHVTVNGNKCQPVQGSFKIACIHIK